MGFASQQATAGERKRLCLYLLGADHERELPWPELFSWVPHTEIAIVLIGPHTPTMAEREVDTKGTNVLVPPGRRMTVQGVAGCFHELSSAVILALPKPDAVFALNSGLIFYPTWVDTVDRVLVCDVPRPLPFLLQLVTGQQVYNRWPASEPASRALPICAIFRRRGRHHLWCPRGHNQKHLVCARCYLIHTVCRCQIECVPQFSVYTALLF